MGDEQELVLELNEIPTLPVNKLSSESMKFLSLQKLDKILLNQDKLSKCQILDDVAILRDEIHSFC